jgi:SulP family sulfate permease
MRERLPPPDSAKHAVLVMRIRGNSQIGPTFIDEINGCARDLAKGGGRLYLCGMTTELAGKLERADRLELDDEVVIVPGEEVLGRSLREAVRQAKEWVARRAGD